ncbi:MAG TPA: hypothetical protein VL988_01975 [Solirubrobacteraceae bacterium]|nr:hypothetical protein [Solirubrobacteraceae bacterium]
MSGAAASPPATARGPRVWWRGLPRSLRRTLIGVTLLVVVVVGVLLARWLSAENAERAADLAFVRAETRGEVGAMLGRISGCRADAACVAHVHDLAGNARLRRDGNVKLLQIESETAHSLFGATGKTRLAWTTLGGKPVVQCVVVKRSGNPLTGIDVELLSVSAPIANTGKCHPETEIERLEREATEAELGHKLGH